ncbi:similar to TATA BOX ASSOCIATED FACTOR II 59 [Actinidia rufa]|uniref:Similar to TATA BOX ASSOCIATED FACTOR II 59 n=1 Tax=Actinidia rufa TaxID=165716 RepID=A0A7J0DER5_9ERIC|nr:similar to TATA BOX ASSOCIATED FACTOR II 59 [Actinidia rufa]
MTKAPLDTSIGCHWLAIEGVQPTIPENAPVEVIAAPSDSKKFEQKDDGLPIDSKLPVKHILSRELQLYFDKITELAVRSDSVQGSLIEFGQRIGPSSFRPCLFGGIRPDWTTSPVQSGSDCLAKRTWDKTELPLIQSFVRSKTNGYTIYPGPSSPTTSPVQSSSEAISPETPYPVRKTNEALVPYFTIFIADENPHICIEPYLLMPISRVYSVHVGWHGRRCFATLFRWHRDGYTR